MRFLDKLFNRWMATEPAQTEPAYYEPLRELDYEAAIPPLREAMKREDPVAMTAYAAMLAVGRGVEQDFDEAAAWFRQAAVRGCTYGQLAFGACLASGLGTERNDEEAAYWLYQAAKKNHPAAIDLLSTVVWRNQSVIGKHFSNEQFQHLVKKAHRPSGATLH